MRRVLLLSVGVGLVAAALAGCTAGQQVHQARLAFQQAGQAGAESKAPYPYYAAREYLGMAEHEWNTDFDGGAARAYAMRSMEFSEEAVQKSGGAQ